MLLFNRNSVGEFAPVIDLNTSNVIIQPAGVVLTLPEIEYLNTSNVIIQPTILSHLFYSQFHYTHYISTFS